MQPSNPAQGITEVAGALSFILFLSLNVPSPKLTEKIHLNDELHTKCNLIKKHKIPPSPAVFPPQLPAAILLITWADIRGM